MNNLKIKNFNTVGSSHHYTFTEEEDRLVYDWFDTIEGGYPGTDIYLDDKDSEKLRRLIEVILDEVDHKEKYSLSVGIEFNGWKFCIYASYGVFRIGAGSTGVTSLRGELDKKIGITSQLIQGFIYEIKKL